VPPRARRGLPARASRFPSSSSVATIACSFRRENRPGSGLACRCEAGRLSQPCPRTRAAPLRCAASHPLPRRAHPHDGPAEPDRRGARRRGGPDRRRWKPCGARGLGGWLGPGGRPRRTRAALLPGFIDAHGHFPGRGIFAVQIDLNSPPVGDVETMEDLLERLRERARKTRSGRWIVGWGYDDTLLAEKRHPTRDLLDAVSQEHPIVLWHVSGHLVAANGLALERAGIDADTPDPEGGLIRRDPHSGEPDGVLEEAASDSLQEGLRPSFLDGLRIARAGSAIYLRAGVTTVQSGYILRRALGSPGRRQAARRRVDPGLHGLPEPALSRATRRRLGLSGLPAHPARGADREGVAPSRRGLATTSSTPSRTPSASTRARTRATS